LPVDVNSLYLPPSLPDGVYIIVTVRRVVDLHLQVSNPQTLDLEADSEGNLRDIKTYIEKYVVRKQMHDRLSAWAVTREQFTDTLVKKSQGNFMYLYYILPAIEGGKFADGRLDELPEGLLAYYQRHWRQMREGNERDFDKLYEPIVCILGVAQEPITLEHISNWTKLEKSQVKQAIDKWYEFLLDTRQAEQHSYRIYHASFQDFLKNEVDLTKYHKMIADYYLRLANMK